MSEEYIKIPLKFYNGDLKSIIREASSLNQLKVLLQSEDLEFNDYQLLSYIVSKKVQKDSLKNAEIGRSKAKTYTMEIKNNSKACSKKKVLNSLDNLIHLYKVEMPVNFDIKPSLFYELEE